MLILEVLNVALFVFHSAFILFVLLGWIWKATRKSHLVSIILTALSWFGLGLWYGFGYCPFTDWHWTVRERLGYGDMPYSYIKFLIDAGTGLDVNATAVDVGTVTAFMAAAVLAGYTNLRDARRKRADRT